MTVHEQREFWSKVAQKYDRVVDLQIGPTIRAMVRARLAEEGSLGDVAEFGCGTGFYTPALAARATRILATDLSPAMLALAKARVDATNVTFETQDCQHTSLPDESFDTAFISLVIHFTTPDTTLAEMRRILKPGGTLIIANLDPFALNGLGRLRSLLRVLYRGLTGYRTKPPKGFGRNMLSEEALCDLLRRSGFERVTSESIRDPSRSSSIPIDYVRATRV